MSVLLIILVIAVVWTAVGVAVAAFLGAMARRRPQEVAVVAAERGDRSSLAMEGSPKLPSQRESRDTTAV